TFFTIAICSSRSSRLRQWMGRAVLPPRVLTTGMLFGAIISTAVSVPLGELTGLASVGLFLVLTGWGAIVREAWKRDATWVRILKAKSTWLGGLSILAGSMLQLRN